MRRILVVVLAVGLVACREPTKVTTPLHATYVLTRVNGASLPAVVGEGGGQRYTLLADTLQFELDGQVRRTQVVHWVSSTFAPGDTTYAQRITLPYTIDGSSLMIGYAAPCPPNASCIGFDAGEIDDAKVTMVARMFWAGEPKFVYQRVR